MSATRKAAADLAAFSPRKVQEVVAVAGHEADDLPSLDTSDAGSATLLDNPQISPACENQASPLDTAETVASPDGQPGDVKSSATATVDPASNLDKLMAAYDANTAIRAMSGPINGPWSARARAMLAGALRFLPIYAAADDHTRKAYRQHIKKERGKGQGPNKNNLALIAVQTCIPPKNIAEQKEMSRFACVVKVAHQQGVEADGADSFLEANSLNRCVEIARRGPNPNGPRKKPVPIVMKGSPTFHSMLIAGDG